MERLVGMYVTNAHIVLMLDGWHLVSTSMNSNVIFNVYTRENSKLVLLIDKQTHNIGEVA
jgi:hypothetical protein